MAGPRMPAAVRKRLTESLDRITNGPSGPMTDPTRSEDFNAGLAEGLSRHAGWRASWIEHELRQVLAWAEGAETAHDIAVYGLGMEHGKSTTTEGT